MQNGFYRGRHHYQLSPFALASDDGVVVALVCALGVIVAESVVAVRSVSFLTAIASFIRFLLHDITAEFVRVCGIHNRLGFAITIPSSPTQHTLTNNN